MTGRESGTKAPAQCGAQYRAIDRLPPPGPSTHLCAVGRSWPRFIDEIQRSLRHAPELRESSRRYLENVRGSYWAPCPAALGSNSW